MVGLPGVVRNDGSRLYPIYGSLPVVTCDCGVLMGIAVALSFDDLDTGAVTRQRQLPHQSRRNFAQSLHVIAPSFASKHATESDPVSQYQSYRPFRERVRDALKARLHPNTNLHAKQLAYVLQLSEPTIWNLLSANNEPSGRTIDKLVGFFKDQFINEIWGCHNIYCLDRGDERRADAMRRIDEAQAELRAMEGER
jgi:predicted DNA-binding transcriptional regulator AlpA